MTVRRSAKRTAERSWQPISRPPAQIPSGSVHSSGEIPLLSRLRKDFAAQKVEVIGIAVDFRDDVLAFADKQKLDYPLLIGSDALTRFDALVDPSRKHAAGKPACATVATIAE